MLRDGKTKSIWQNLEDYKPAIAAKDNIFYDVIIIGAGITGITTGLELQRKGKKCLILESNTVGFGTTGGTTAHLNTFFDTPYYKVIKDYNLESAKVLAHGAHEAISLIKNNIGLYDINCDFKELEGYLFSVNQQQDKELDDIIESSKKVGVKVDLTNNSPFPIPYLKLAAFSGQAQFHPIKYLFAIAKEFEKIEGVILQHSKVVEVNSAEGDVTVKTLDKSFNTMQVIYATHIPPGINLLHMECAPYRSYVVAAKLDSDQYPLALGYDMNDPYHYYRTQIINGENFLIAGGEDHKTGHEENPKACFRRLESHIRSYFEVKKITYKWSSQYYETIDGLPYIGYLPGNSKNIFVATGYSGNGMIYGSLAAIVLSEIITEGKSKYTDLFNPSRIKPVAGFANFIKEGSDVVKNFIKDKFSLPHLKGLVEIAAGEAKVIKYEGQTLALYKDENHIIHAVGATCTHMKCTVHWNSSEKSWDCPCHGARFSIEGKVLNGPALEDLPRIEL